MAEKATIARPYAKAAFEDAQANHSFAEWSEALATASAVIADARVHTLLNDPRVTTAELVALVADVGGVKVDQRGRNFLQTLADNRRLALLPEITAMYEVLRAETENVADVQVTSAIALDEAQKQRLAGALQKRLKRDVRLHCSVDSTLIGGAIIRSGDMVIDGSLKTRLDRLANAITY